MDRLDKAAKKLAAAQNLLESEFYEDSISRSYYAMYHAAKFLLEHKDITVSTHSGLIRMVGKEFVKPGRIKKSLGKALSMAEEDREMADYDIEAKFTKIEAEERLEDAKQFVEKAKELV